jgi:hypothetical protein
LGKGGADAIRWDRRNNTFIVTKTHNQKGQYVTIFIYIYNQGGKQFRELKKQKISIYKETKTKLNKMWHFQFGIITTIEYI